MTQREMVKEYLVKHGSITPRQAARPPIRTMRLADHIHKLRKAGMDIHTRMIYKTVDGMNINYAEYWIEGNKERSPEVAGGRS